LANQKHPGNYVELVEGDEAGHATSAAQPSHMSIATPLPPTVAVPAEPKGGATATALYDYEAAGEFEVILCNGVDDANTSSEDNELSFPDGAKIANVVRNFITLLGRFVADYLQEFPDEDWWLGEYGGKTGLFPANYVQLDE
jgi:drebrin-like protein